MNAIVWMDFLNILPFMLLGLIYHLIQKVITAKEYPDYSWKVFKSRNLFGMLNSLILCSVGLAFLSSGIELMPGINRIVISFIIGSGGGDIVRSWTEKIRS
jgi:hypothetical protein